MPGEGESVNFEPNLKSSSNYSKGFNFVLCPNSNDVKIDDPIDLTK